MVRIRTFHILLGCSILIRGLRYGATSSLPRGVERAEHPVAQLVHPFRHVDRYHLARVPSARNCGYSTCPFQKHLGPGGVPREALDARHDPPEQGSCQVAFDPNRAGYSGGRVLTSSSTLISSYSRKGLGVLLQSFA